MNKYKKILFLSLLVVLTAVGLFFGNNVIKAQTENNQLSGWAWSDNIGWISMNSTTYSVTKDSNGYLKGYAWSDNIGWIKFDPTGPYPSQTGNIQSGAKINTDNTLSGWIRACAGTVNGDCTGASRTDGWDGWISLKGPTYGTQLTSTACSNFNCQTDWAWGSDVVGWVNLSGVALSGNVISARCDGSPSGQSITWNASASGGNGTYTYSWSGTESLSGSQAEVTKTYSSYGTKTGKVTVTSGGMSATSLECSATISNGDSTPSCEGTSPEGGSGVIVNSEDPTQDTNWTYDSSGELDGACKWTCDTGYNKSGNGCILGGGETLSCGGELPKGSGIKMDASKLPTEENQNWTYVSLSTYDGQACQWTCKKGYNRKGTYNECRPIVGYEEI